MSSPYSSTPAAPVGKGSIAKNHHHRSGGGRDCAGSDACSGSSGRPKPKMTNNNNIGTSTKIFTEILPDDILLGRGALAISNEGNVRFRNIIAGRKDEYISTSRRLKKDTIANEIRTLIAARKGRFLRRVTSEEKLSLGVGGDDATDAGSPTAAAGGCTKGVDAWAVADEEVVLAKIKQSLRDKEPDERENGGGGAAAAAASSNNNNKRSLTGSGGGGNNLTSNGGGGFPSQQQQQQFDVHEELAKRARLRQAVPTLDWSDASLALPDRAEQGLAAHRQQQQQQLLMQDSLLQREMNGGGSGGDDNNENQNQARLMGQTLQERALEEELQELRERQRILISRSMLYGGGGAFDSSMMPPSPLSSSSGLDLLARYRQLDLLSASSGGGGVGQGSISSNNNNLDMFNPPLTSTSASLEQLLRGTAPGSGGGGGQQQQDSVAAASSQQRPMGASTAGQDSVIASLRQELELKERRAQIDALLVHREEELLLRLLEQERDASLVRLRRQEAMLAALRQGRPLPDLDGGLSSTSAMRSVGGGGNGLFRDADVLGGQQGDLLRRQAELASLLGSRSMLNAASLDTVPLLGASRFGRQTADGMLLDAPAGRQDSFDHNDHANNLGHGKKVKERQT